MTRVSMCSGERSGCVLNDDGGGDDDGRGPRHVPYSGLGGSRLLGEWGGGAVAEHVLTRHDLVPQRPRLFGLCGTDARDSAFRGSAYTTPHVSLHPRRLNLQVHRSKRHVHRQLITTRQCYSSAAHSPPSLASGDTPFTGCAVAHRQPDFPLGPAGML